MTTVCVWYRDAHPAGWMWDDSEDHGGFDRISPMGPFNSKESAIQDARNCFGHAEAIDGYPDHYPSGESVP